MTRSITQSPEPRAGQLAVGPPRRQRQPGEPPQHHAREPARARAFEPRAQRRRQRIVVAPAARVARVEPASVLEIAAGTGVATRALADRLAPSVEITASDLNPDMITHAIAVGTSRPVHWRQADVMMLPATDSSTQMMACATGIATTRCDKRVR